VGALKLVAIVLWGFTLLPHKDVRGWDETHSLNGPLWSLLQEYLANVFYALIGRHMNRTTLIGFVFIWGAILTGVAVWRGDLATGWGYNTFWIGVVRMMFPFFAGLLLYRSGFMIRIPAAYLICSLLLVALFFFPTYSFNGWYEAASIIIAFPLIVAMGAGGTISGRWAQICNFAGIISYPIYIVHYPFMYIYMEWIHLKPDPGTIIMVGIVLLFFFIGLAYVVLKRYDEPVRNWLKQNWR
jgi:peptidoglycan/LPS O-acetylase OafA/YrhL